MNDTITITAGRPEREAGENDFTGSNGTYTVTLIRVSDVITEKSTMPDAKNDTYSYRIWTLAIDDEGDNQGQVIDVRASTASGPKSKQYGIITAFVGRTPPVGAELSIQKHLVGRQALAQILTNENDYPYVDKVMALPQKQQAAPKAPEAEAALPF